MKHAILPSTFSAMRTFSLVCLLTSSVFAQFPEYKVTAADGAAGDKFGNAVAIDGDYAVIGAPFHDARATNAGAIYVFKWNGARWLQHAKLMASDARAEDRFGQSVAISGDHIVVGVALRDDHGQSSGAAYVFHREVASDGWNQQAKLHANDAAAEDRFGISVAIDGDYILVGADLDDNEAGTNAGAAYVFKRAPDGSGWTEEAKLIAQSDDTAKDHFGFSVDIDGEFVVIGAPNDWADGPSRWLQGGSAYVFERNNDNFTQSARVAINTAPPFDFGYSVSIDNAQAFVGAPVDVSGGGVHIYNNEASWSRVSKIIAREADEFDSFGFSISLYKNYSIIGAYQDSRIGEFAGAAYLYNETRSGWFEATRLTASDASSGDQYGYAVAVSGRFAIVGAHQDDDRGSNSGSAYFYELNPALCNDLSLPDTAAYGLIPGGDQGHPQQIEYCFTGQPGDMIVSFQTHAIDDPDEVDVLANGTNLFDVPSTGLGQWSADLRVLLPDPLLHNNFANSLVFKHQTPSSSWGIRQVKLDSCFRLPALAAYGKLDRDDETHVERVAFCFAAQSGDVTLMFEPFDIDSRETVDLRLNGTKVDTLSPTGNNEWGSAVRVILPDSLVNDVGANFVEFINRHNPAKNWLWGVRNVRTITPTTAVKQPGSSRPDEFRLAQNYPNPFNPTTTLSFDVPRDDKVTLTVYSLTGERVATLVDDFLPAGHHDFTFDGAYLPSGLYFYRLQTTYQAATGKMVLAK